MSKKQFRPNRERILVRIVELEEHTTPSGLLLSVLATPGYKKGIIVGTSKDVEGDYVMGSNVLIEGAAGLEVRSQDLGLETKEGVDAEEGKYVLVKPEEILGMYF